MATTTKKDYGRNAPEGSIRPCKGKPVYCVELDEIFPSASVAARELGLQASHISKCCRGVNKTHGDYHWEFVRAKELTDNSAA